jgi:hypothetical protein
VRGVLCYFAFVGAIVVVASAAGHKSVLSVLKQGSNNGFATQVATLHPAKEMIFQEVPPPQHEHYAMRHAIISLCSVV